MARLHLVLLGIIGFIVLAHGSAESNPIQIMKILMRRMKAEFKHLSTRAQKNRQFFKFRHNLAYIVQTRFVIKRPPPPDVVMKLKALEKSEMQEMERNLRALLSSIGAAFGHEKVHLLVKKIRDLCNRHIEHERKKIDLKLREVPRKTFIAIRGKWTELEANYECYKRGGHLAMIETAQDHFNAFKSMKTTKMNFYINAIHPLGGRGMWLMSSLRPWFPRPRSFNCIMLVSKNNAAIKSVDCETKQGAVCEFLSFNPYIRYTGVKRVFFSLSDAGTYIEGSRHCNQHGGKIAIIQDHEDLKSAQRVNDEAVAFINIGSHIVRKNPHFCKSGNVSKKMKPYRYAIKKGGCYRVMNDEFHTPLCEIHVLKDRISRSIHPTAIGKVFVAFNKATDKYSKTEGASKCHSIGGTIARIRNNRQQLAAVEELHHGLPVRFDNLAKSKDKSFWWSDGTRIPKSQEWRVDHFNTNQGISLNKFGEWDSAIDRMGVLCEVIRKSGEDFNGIGFKTEIRMNIDFEQVTSTAKSERIFNRALESEIRNRCTVKEKGVKDVIVISLRPGSTIAKIRVWAHSDGRAEASALQNSLNAGIFSIMFMGRKILPIPGQFLSVDFDNSICIFRVHVPTKLIYCAIPGAIAVVTLMFIVAMVFVMRRKKRPIRVNSVFIADKEKELMAAQEEKGSLPICDAPPPYPASDDIPPDYDSCLKSENLKI